jgi:hypothetical protein
MLKPFALDLATARFESITARIPLYTRNGDGVVRAWAIVDREDSDALLAYRWSLLRKKTNAPEYATRAWWDPVKRRQGTTSMHRQIMGLAPGDPGTVDHINRNGLDNRRSNLRVVTHKVNTLNVAARGGSSPHRGVSRNPNGTWRAKVGQSYLGQFETEEDAARVALEERLRRGAVD